MHRQEERRREASRPREPQRRAAECEVGGPAARLAEELRLGAGGGADGVADSGGSGCADDAWVRGVAPLAPRGWHNAFTPSEPLRSPAGWPGAVGRELLGSSSSQGALKEIRAADR